MYPLIESADSGGNAVIHKSSASQEFDDWVKETINLLHQSLLPVALISNYPILLEYVLSLIANELEKEGKSLGQLTIPVNARGLMDLVKKAPGILAIKASQVFLGTNLFEVHNDMQNVIASLADKGLPVIFHGNFQELQAVFAGQSTNKEDAFLPVVRRIPKHLIEPENIIRCWIYHRTYGTNPIPENICDEIVDLTLEAFRHNNISNIYRIIKPVINTALSGWVKHGFIGKHDINATMARLQLMVEKIGGIEGNKAVEVPSALIAFSERFMGDELNKFLKSQIIAQDEPIDELCYTLKSEFLTRETHIPPRLCIVSSPGTGKSQTAKLIAEFLGIPHLSVDLAGMSDYTAYSNLLGSARGLVGSNERTILQKASDQPCVLECNDLDHNLNPAVRKQIADIFLTLLEEGQGQTAKGHTFYVNNIIFIFTMNLPGGRDEDIRKKLGFIKQINRNEMCCNANNELKRIFSTAFLSRLGTPVIYNELCGEDLQIIAERHIAYSVKNIFSRMHINVGEYIIEEGIGEMVFNEASLELGSYGARAIIEKSRNLSIKAFENFYHSNIKDTYDKIFIKVIDNQLNINTQENEANDI